MISLIFCAVLGFFVYRFVSRGDWAAAAVCGVILVFLIICAAPQMTHRLRGRREDRLREARKALKLERAVTRERERAARRAELRETLRAARVEREKRHARRHAEMERRIADRRAELREERRQRALARQARHIT